MYKPDLVLGIVGIKCQNKLILPLIFIFVLFAQVNKMHQAIELGPI